MPKAYFFGEIKIHDPDGYAAYRDLSSAAVVQYGGRFLVRGGARHDLEGASKQGVRTVIFEFDSIEAARRFYDSAEYSAARAIRQRCSDGNFSLIEGIAI